MILLTRQGERTGTALKTSHPRFPGLVGVTQEKVLFLFGKLFSHQQTRTVLTPGLSASDRSWMHCAIGARAFQHQQNRNRPGRGPSSKMEKYRLVQEHKGDGEDFLEPTASCEVRITQQGKPRNYISYAMGLFADGSDTIVLKAMGRAINKAVTIAEILKRKMPLHQLNSLSSVEMVDVFEPLEEGLDTVTSRRFVSCMKITLSRTSEGIDQNDIGYQPPLPVEEMHPGDFHPLREAALIASS